MDWDIELGGEDTRTAIQARHGGSLSRGISAPAIDGYRHNVFLWWRPERGTAFGYADGWSASGDAFYFSGSGQIGDQAFGVPNSENGRVRDHVQNGDHIRLLRYVAPNRVCYVAELRLDPRDPWRWRDGSDRFGDLRKMIQFRFLPIGHVLRLDGDPVREATSARPTVDVLRTGIASPSATDVETLSTRSFLRLLSAREVLSERVELKLVYAFRDWLKHAYGLHATGLRIPYAPESRDLRADLFVTVPRVLVEAKASAAREKIRLAIGQLLDYGRYLDPPGRLCILLPSAPPPDMLPLLEDLGIAVAWPDGASYETRPEHLFQTTPA